MRKRLPEYEAKRDFAITPEPAPGTAPESKEPPSFVVHKHDATRLHYDVRLEMDSALASWSVPKGPSYDPNQKRLAIQTEDHPLEYGNFEGRIPDGEYGAGDSLIWDRGTYESVPPGTPSEQRKKGHLRVRFHGSKLDGEWHLVRTGGMQGTKSQWLMFKARDGKENPAYDVVTDRPESVVSGRVATRGPERAGVLRAPRAPPETLLKGLLPPMLATLVDEAPRDEENWIVERKYDGYRALCALSNGRVAMQTRNALDLNARFPAIARSLSQIVVGDAVIDGEIAILDPLGVPRFELIQQGRNEEAILFAFDLLRLDGEDLRERPVEQRRDLLGSLLSNTAANLRVSEELHGAVKDLLAEAAKSGWEGVVMKRRASPYQKGRSHDWLKLKALQSQELAIVGWTPGEGAASSGIGALLLGVNEGGTLEFAGKVGTGFSAKQRKELLAELGKDEVDAPEVRGAPRMRDAHWVKPRLIAQVRFTEWTHDAKLRHPSFQGLRPDKTPMETVREKPATPPKGEGKKRASARTTTAPKSPSRAAKAVASAPAKKPNRTSTPEVQLSNPGRVFYPKDGVTKQDVAAYYESVADPLLAAIADRPLAVIHWNQGIGKPGWFEQNTGQNAEPWMTVVDTPSAKAPVRHLIADRSQTLRWLAQHAALELHMWHSRAQNLTMPDWVVFDLDPAEGKGIEQAIEVAEILHGMFDRLGLPSVPKTTGKRGIHVFVPLAAGHTYDDAQAFALSVGDTVVKQLPQVTLERAKEKRKGRLYFDCMQNGYGKTVIAPYSLRGVEGAPVSAPLKWSEVRAGLDPKQFNLRTMPARLKEVGDLFAPALKQGVRLPRFKR
ncbi:MAG TPA: DNA ligase D [Myxococcales bacterium]|nr:DNA ligase D [Myxococcales bacterium]